jgi:opacity protein-like surface antigen
MKLRHLASLAILLFASSAAQADREPGWEFGGEVLYQFGDDIDFEGGSLADLDDDVGLALVFAYRFNNRLDLQFSLDWNTIDYNIDVESADTGGIGFSAEGDLESFTPRVALNFNILEGDFTPYITGGVGWAFIDTNIPDERAQSGCYWDPWWGYVCGTWQSTRSIDELTYSLGVGVRWDISDTITLKMAYEEHWIELEQADGTPALDQLKFGIYARY